MARKNFYPDSHWKLEVDIPWTMAIHHNDMVILNAQGDFDAEGNVGHPYDLEGQTRVTLDYIKDMLATVGCGQGDITNLRVEYVTDGAIDEDAYRAEIAAQLPGAHGATIEFLPFDRLVYPDLMVEIDTYAMLRQDGTRLARAVADPGGLYPPAGPFAHGLRSGNMIYIGDQLARAADGSVLYPGDPVRQSEVILDNIGRILAKLGASHDDVVRFNIFYVGEATAEAWAEHARVRASYFTEPGPATTAIPLPRLHPPGAVIMMCCWAMLGEDGSRLPRTHSWPEGHWDWPIHLPWKHGCRCRDMVFVGGQVSITPEGQVIDPGELDVQTRRTMTNIDKVLAEFGLGLPDVHKLSSFYVMDTVEAFLQNLETRSSYFTKPGPAVVGLPLDTLAYPDMMIEIEVIAMAD